MIFFKPVTYSDNPSFVQFEAIENEILCGKCYLEISGVKAFITSIDYESNKPYLIEGLLKSAFNYAALKNCYMGYCKCDNITDFLDKMNFEKENGIYFNDIPTILQGNCCK